MIRLTDSWVPRFYEDNGIIGHHWRNGRDKRPGIDRLLKDATARKINMIAAWSVDRLGRSLQDLVGFRNEVHALHCHLLPPSADARYEHRFGRAMLKRAASLRNEPAMIRERINAGLARAKARGVSRKGEPLRLGSPRVN